MNNNVLNPINSLNLIEENQNLSKIDNTPICTFDLLNHYNINGNKGTCKHTPYCNFIHYESGPKNEGNGWKLMTKTEILSRIRSYHTESNEIIKCIENDITLIEGNNTKDIISKDNITYICMFDVLYHYGIGEKGKCGKRENCMYLHYNYGPNKTKGWNTMTKSQVLECLPTQLFDPRVKTAIENDDKLIVESIIIDKSNGMDIIEDKSL